MQNQHGESNWKCVQNDINRKVHITWTFTSSGKIWPLRSLPIFQIPFREIHNYTQQTTASSRRRARFKPPHVKWRWLHLSPRVPSQTTSHVTSHGGNQMQRMLQLLEMPVRLKESICSRIVVAGCLIAVGGWRSITLLLRVDGVDDDDYGSHKRLIDTTLHLHSVLVLASTEEWRQIEQFLAHLWEYVYLY